MLPNGKRDRTQPSWDALPVLLYCERQRRLRLRIREGQPSPAISLIAWEEGGATNFTRLLLLSLHGNDVLEAEIMS